MYNRLYYAVFISLLYGSIIFAQNSHFVSKLDKSQLDLNYYERLKDKNITLNVCNWGEYIADGSKGSMDIIKEFENLTGIKVNYIIHNSNEEVYAKLKLYTENYDVITPTDYIIVRMIKNDMIQKLNFDLLPAVKKNIDPFFFSLAYDPKGEYSVPYTWGMSGIIYNKKNIDIKEEDIDWSILFNEDYKDMILMAIAPRDAFAAANGYLGFDLHTTNEKEILKSFDALKKQRAVVQDYVMDEILYKIRDEKAYIGVTYGGDALTVIKQNTNINFVIPKSGGNPFVECLAIPKNAENIEAAHMYINFLCERQISYENTKYIGYATPNTAALELLPDEIKNDKRIYPDKKNIVYMSKRISELDDRAGILMENLWNNFLNNKSVKLPFNKILVFAVIITTIILIILEVKKRKKD
ncbi:ABC transporter substrate-binding protein [Brachyspira sp. G79]|uniref:ABC transporter substrate-binding protein n=1 Tax=Brachyspira sp. G79 TaxID=1358104 RepID=UPI000BBB762D|nr:ABC transporter substrate-binding protein [Brachyspira sp. G79]